MRSHLGPHEVLTVTHHTPHLGRASPLAEVSEFTNNSYFLYDDGCFELGAGLSVSSAKIYVSALSGVAEINAVRRRWLIERLVLFRKL